jgi:hypothetical protein
MKPVLAMLVVMVAATVFVSAKGRTTRIEVTGAELRTPVEITDPEILEDFNVWSGPGTFINGLEGTEGFIIDWPSGAVRGQPQRVSRYDVLFYVKYENRTAREQEDQLAYKVVYAIDSSSGEGYVYLPGKGDEPYLRNINAIYRGHEGRWFHATAAWQRAVDRLIARAR